MFNVTKVVHFDPAANDDARKQFESDIREIAATRAEHFLIAPTLPGSINGGDLIVHLQFPDRDALDRCRDTVESALKAPAVKMQYGVGYESGVAGRAPDRPHGGVYRTLLMRVHPATAPGEIERFEKDLLSMPQHISSMTAWSLSRVAESTGPFEWTHVWEQEFTDPSAVTGQYLDHPVHWAVVDRWFDPECTEVIIRDRVCHTFCELDAPLIP